MRHFKKLWLIVVFPLTFSTPAYPALKKAGLDLPSLRKTGQTILSLVKEKETVSLGEILNVLPLLKGKIPKKWKFLYETLKFRNPKITSREDQGTIEIFWKDPFVGDKQRRGFSARFYIDMGGPMPKKPPAKKPGDKVAKKPEDKKPTAKPKPAAQAKKKEKKRPFGFSFGVGFPGRNTFRSLFPETKDALKPFDWLGLEDLWIVAGLDYDDPLFGPIKMGLNLQYKLALEGPITDMFNKIGIKDLLGLTVRGHVPPAIIGLRANVASTANIDLIKIPWNDNPKFLIRVLGPELEMGIKKAGGVPVPTLKLIGRSQMKLPGQKELLTGKVFVDFMGIKTEIGAQMDGMIKNIFGIPGVDVGDLGLAITLVPPATPGGLAMQGTMNVGKVKLQVVFKGDVLGDFALIASATGGLTNKDIVEFILKTMTETSKTLKVNVDFTKFKTVLNSIVPPMRFGDFLLRVVPTATEVFGVKYGAGTHIKGEAEIFGIGGELEIILSKMRFKAMGMIYEWQFPKRGKPLIYVTGGGRQATEDKPARKGAIVDIDLSPGNPYVNIDSEFGIPPLGWKDKVKIKASIAGGLEIEIEKKLLGIFDSKLNVMGNPKKGLDGFSIEGHVATPGIEAVMDKIRKSTDKFANNAKNGLNKALNAVKKWEAKAKRDVDAWFNREKEKVNKPIRNIERKIAINKAKCKKKKILCLAMGIANGALHIARGTLIAHRDVTVSKIGRAIAKSGVKFVSGVAKVGLKTAKAAVKAAQKTIQIVTKVISAVAKGMIQILKIHLKGTMTDLVRNAKLAAFTVTFRFAGKTVTQLYQVDFKRPGQIFQQLLSGFKKLFG